MNSFNHYAYGSIMGWLYRDAAGIRPLKPGFEEIEIAPHPDPRLGSLDCEYETPRGLVSVSWRYENGGLKWSCSVPQGVKFSVKEPFVNHLGE
jgi:alpha-L-rhamnosidase